MFSWNMKKTTWSYPTLKVILELLTRRESVSVIFHLQREILFISLGALKIPLWAPMYDEHINCPLPQNNLVQHLGTVLWGKKILFSWVLLACVNLSSVLGFKLQSDFFLPERDMKTSVHRKRTENHCFKDVCLVGCDCINYKSWMIKVGYINKSH